MSFHPIKSIEKKTEPSDNTHYLQNEDHYIPFFCLFLDF